MSSFKWVSCLNFDADLLIKCLWFKAWLTWLCCKGLLIRPDSLKHRFRLSAEDNVANAANKALRVLLNGLSRPLSSVFFLPLYKMFSRPHLEYAIQASYPATQRHWKRCRSSLLMEQLPLLSPTHALIPLFKITQSLLEFPMESTFTHPTRKGLRGLAYKFHQQKCCTRRRQYAFTIRAVPFWNKRPAEIVNASSV